MPRRLGLATAMVLALVQATPARAADPIMPLSSVRAGMHCIGKSVVRGTTISTFDVEILDVIAGDPAYSGPRILVRVSGPAVDATGIAAGFSGSPVYCDRGDGIKRNAGAISEGLGDYGDDVVLATPIEEILTERPAATPAGARRDPALRAAARPLAAPLSFAGLSGRARSLLMRAARKAGRLVLSAPSGPIGGYPVQELRPGASVSVALSTGDVPLGATGTVAYRDGPTVWAFGHPLDAFGPRSLFLQDAYVFGVIANPLAIDEIGAISYKLATANGHTVGRLTNDATAAVVGAVGPPPSSVGLVVSARDIDRGRREVLSSQLADERAYGLGASAGLVAPLAAIQAAEQLLRADVPVRAKVCVNFAVRERPRRFGFCNAYFSFDEALDELSEAASLVELHDLSPLHLERIRVDMRLRRGAPQEVLLRGRAPRRVRRGRRALLRVLVQRRNGGRRVLRVPVRIPRHARPGGRVVVLEGIDHGGGRPGDDEIVDGLALILVDAEFDTPPSKEPRTIGELVRAVRALHRPVGIRARFRKKGGSVVYRNGDVSFSGRIAVPLRIVR